MPLNGISTEDRPAALPEEAARAGRVARCMDHRQPHVLAEVEPLASVIEETDGTFVFSGKVSVDEVMDRLGVAIEREGFETVGGYLLSHLGRMPYVGERFDVDGLEVEVLEVERRRIAKVRLRRREPAALEGER